MARRLLAVVGVAPGIAVFTDDAGDDSKWGAVCIKVRGHSETGAPIDLYPPDGFCQRSGFRFRLPPMELALLNMLQQAKAHHLAWTRQPSGQSNRWQRDAVLASMARHFCGAARPAGGRTELVTVVWYLYLQSYATGAETRGAFLSFGWDCEQARIDHEIWLPDDATVVLHWGEEPWE